MGHLKCTVALNAAIHGNCKTRYTDYMVKVLIGSGASV